MDPTPEQPSLHLWIVHGSCDFTTVAWAASAAEATEAVDASEYADCLELDAQPVPDERAALLSGGLHDTGADDPPWCSPDLDYPPSLSEIAEILRQRVASLVRAKAIAENGQVELAL